MSYQQSKHRRLRCIDKYWIIRVEFSLELVRWENSVGTQNRSPGVTKEENVLQKLRERANRNSGELQQLRS